MKKILLFISATCTILSAGAAMPENLRRYAEKDADQMAIFDAMDRAEDYTRDSMNKITYDAYPDGKRNISRQLTNTLAFESARKSVRELNAVFDSIISQPNPQCFVFKNDNTIICQFRPAEANSMIVDFSDSNFAAQKNASAFTTRSGYMDAAQSWTITTDMPVQTGDFTAIKNQFDKIAARQHSIKQNVRFPIQAAQGGALRLRDHEIQSDNQVIGKRVIDAKASTSDWIHTYDLFMAHFGADEDISLTYYRNKRMVTLINYTTKTIYAACFRSDIPNMASNGTLTILIADYTGPIPYLPENWATGNYNAGRNLVMSFR